MSPSFPSEPLVRRLRQLGGLSGDVPEEIRKVLATSLSYPAESCLTLKSGQMLLVASGWASRFTTLADGRQQILSLLISGDVAGRPSRIKADTPILLRCITQLRVCDVSVLLGPDAQGRPLYPTLQDAITYLEQQLEIYLCSQIVRLGALSAYKRVADLFLEIFNRLSAVGLTNGNQFLMPLTQVRLGEMLGLSETHVNRTMRQLREDGLVIAEPGWFALPDPEALRIRLAGGGLAKQLACG